ncbi:MAG TPA: hypothetical protein DCY35_04670 [Prolixibacteraceae bacterium]|nr:hypothetical protein [Prolixibacteraceae bacterium]
MGKGATGTENAAKGYNNVLAVLSLTDYLQRNKLKKSLINQSMDFVKSDGINKDLNIMESPYFDSVKGSLENTFASQKNSLLNEMPVGGAMGEGITDLYGQKNQGILDQLVQSELDRVWQKRLIDQNQALTLGTGGVTNMISGLSAAGGNTASLAGAQASRANAEMSRYFDMLGGQAASNAAGGACSFCFTAIQGQPHPVVRAYRDKHTTIRNRRGYYWFSDRVVPMMEKHYVIKLIIKLLMTSPMTSYGKYRYGYNKIGALFAPLTAMWLCIFNILGIRKPYRRRGTMEVV